LRTQYELLQSKSLAKRVALSAHLADDKTFLHPRKFSLLGAIIGLFQQEAPKGPQSTHDLINAAASIIQQNISVRPVPGSRLVDVSYTDPDPARSQRIAAAYADAFIASNLDKRFEANAYAKTFLEDQIKQLKLRLENRKKRCSILRKKSRSSP
jgi:polysaccharide biosynthesis transport protein